MQVTREQWADVRRALGLIQQFSHHTATEKGWHERDRSFAEEIALFHSELSEALEIARLGWPLDHISIDKEDGKPDGIGVELADCLIRIADTCERHGIDLGRALVLKMEYNTTRPHMHGKVF